MTLTREIVRRAPRWGAAGAVVLALAATSAEAQISELPTLEGLGVEYVSPSGFVQLLFSGQLDVDLMGVDHPYQRPPAGGLTACDVCHIDVQRGLREGSGTPRTHRLRIFADLFVGDHINGQIEIRADRGFESFDKGTRGRFEQAFVQLTNAGGDRGLQVGRFANPLGSYMLRHLGPDDPFVTPPLLYDYRTVLNRWIVPADATGLLGWKDMPEAIDRPGAPPIWDVPYQWGAMLFSPIGAVDVSLSLMNSAPSSHPGAWKHEWSRFERGSVVATARWRASASVEVGGSYNRGPWMESGASGTIMPPPGWPAGRPPPSISDHDQVVYTADATFARGGSVLKAEVTLDRWEVPNVVSVPTDVGLNLEAQHDLAAGLSIAARYGRIDFRPIDDGLGAGSPYPDGRSDWDHDVQRIEGSVGYRLTRNAGVLLSAYEQIQSGAEDGDRTFVGLRLWWAF